MREIRFDDFGGPEVLTLHADAPEPTPGPGELLIAVDMIGLNPLDAKIRDGSSALASRLALPAGTGREMVGTVLGAGEDLDETELGALGLSVGTRVFGMRGLDDLRGTAADRVVMRADDLAPVPTGAGPDALPIHAGLALVGLTAFTVVHDCTDISEGSTVLVHGGTGGVGQMLIPLVREAGATRVWATGRAANAERIRELGAEPIPYDETDWVEAIREATDGRGVDAVLDTHYHSTFLPSLDVIAPGGCIVALPTLADLSPAEERGITARIPRIRGGRDRLDHLVSLHREGVLSLEIAEVLPPERIGEGHARLMDGHTRGKIVVDLRV